MHLVLGSQNDEWKMNAWFKWKWTHSVRSAVNVIAVGCRCIVYGIQSLGLRWAHRRKMCSLRRWYTSSIHLMPNETVCILNWARWMREEHSLCGRCGKRSQGKIHCGTPIFAYIFRSCCFLPWSVLITYLKSRKAYLFIVSWTLLLL